VRRRHFYLLLLGIPMACKRFTVNEPFLAAFHNFVKTLHPLCLLAFSFFLHPSSSETILIEIATLDSQRQVVTGRNPPSECRREEFLNF
jgi:hypothetical protein